MTNYAGAVFPDAEFYEQALTSSLDDGLVRPEPYALLEEDGLPFSISTLTHSGATPRLTRALSAFVTPSWDSLLFDHILIIPSRLALGNLLSNQTRTLEVANLYLEPRQWLSVSSAVVGLEFLNLPPFGSPVGYELLSFGSYLLQVGISADGPATIDGAIDFDFDVGPQDVPVTGRRIVTWQFQPRPGIEETLEWATDILEAWDGTEQRASLREAPRQVFKVEYIKRTQIERRIRGLLFDWLARSFALPIWVEARTTSAPSLVGTLTLNVPTASADFRVDGLVFVYLDDETFEAIEIDSFTSSAITLKSELARTYPPGALVMPAVTAYAATQPSTPRIPGGGYVYSMQFTTISNIDLPDATGASTYDSRILLDDCNLVESGESDSWSRAVDVIDNVSGRLLQTSRTDRSRFRTQKVWDSPNLATLWRVRRLLHHFAGSRKSFWLPSFNPDIVLAQTIAPNATTFRIVECGYTAFIFSRRPFQDVRLILNDGTKIIRRVTGAVVEDAEEVLTISTTFSTLLTITPAMVKQIEFVNLVRIADDKATITHRSLGDGKIAINVVSIKE